MSTPILPFAVWASGTNQNSIPANDNSMRNQILNGEIIADDVTAQPASPTDGDAYIIPGSATGTQWATFDENDLTIYQGGTWYAFAPVAGIRLTVAGELKQWDGDSYEVIGGLSDAPSDGTGYVRKDGAWVAESGAGGGASIGVQYASDTGSTADSDPGAGLLKWNNATQASATVIFLDDTTGDGVSMTGFWSALDAGGFLYLQDKALQGTWQIWEITTVTDASGYVKFAVTLLAAGDAFADGADMLVTLQQGPSTGGSFTGGSLTSALNEAKGADIASAGTADIGAATGNLVHITGTTNISVLGTVQAGTRRIVVFDAALTLVHNATSLILPGGANITTAAGDCAIFVSEGSGNWRCVNYQPVNGSGDTRGKQAIFIAAAAMRPAINSGCSQLTALASGTGQPDMVTLDYDPGTPEYAQFSIAMPKKWNKGTVTFQPYWSHAATTTNFGVVWSLQAVAVSNDDPIGVAFGTAVNVNDAGGTTDDLYVGPESAAITVAGSPANGDMVFFRMARVANNGSDTMAIDARLHGIQLFVTTDADTDA